MSENLRNKIIEQERVSSQQHNKKIKENKNNIRRSKQARYHSILQGLRNDMPDEKRLLNEINRQQGASTWLTTLPIKEEGSAKFPHLSIRKSHISPPKTKTPVTANWRENEYDIYCHCEKMIY